MNENEKALDRESSLDFHETLGSTSTGELSWFKE